jgi:hypothetical protein
MRGGTYMRKPIVLVVDADAESLESERRFLEAALEDKAVVCRGPRGERQCPLLIGHDCSLIHKANGILFELDLDRDDVRQILGRYVETLDVPIRVVATPDQVSRYSTLLDKVEVVNPPFGPAGLDAFAAEVEHSVD